jgi:hypothetical protein
MRNSDLTARIAMAIELLSVLWNLVLTLIQDGLAERRGDEPHRELARSCCAWSSVGLSSTISIPSSLPVRAAVADEVRLAQRQAAGDRRPDARGVARVDPVEVEAQVHAGGAVRTRSKASRTQTLVPRSSSSCMV